VRFADTISGIPCGAMDFAFGIQPIPGVSVGKDAMAFRDASNRQVLSWLQSPEPLLGFCLANVS
jgi:hypothetical protein